MNKRLIFVLILLIISVSFVSAGFFDGFWNKITGRAGETCTDSDGGIKYLISGTTCIGTTCYNDSCTNSKQVKEYACSSAGLIYARYSNCPILCSNGACVSCINYYSDADNDGYGNSLDKKCLIAAEGNYKVNKAGDCNDANASINPGATETCDSVDNNCNGQIDEECAETPSNATDTVPPVITILGDNPANVGVNTDYTDAGATVLDNADGNLTSSMNVTNNINISITGTYTVTYTATDNSGNTATATRTVNVVNISQITTEVSADIHNPDANNDGIMDAAYSSIDPNGDMDHDGILNIDDFDIDGDGILNGFDVAIGFAGTIRITLTSEVTESGNQQAAPYNGYIVEFTNEPMAIIGTQLEKDASLNEGNLAAQVAGELLPISIAPATSSNINRKINYEISSLKNEREQFKEDALEELGKSEVVEISGTGSVIAGYAAEDVGTDELQVLEEYQDAFNGMVLNITQGEAEKIKNISGVKAVYPNYKVDISLSESVPLINANDVWQLDANGNNCTASGQQCLTGKGITIGIIDTGVDYTHEDLGGCFGTNCKVVSGYDFVNNDEDPMDDMGHGTHVAATAAGDGALKGVAPDAKIYAYKVLDSGGSGYWNNIISAIERSMDPNQDGNFADHLDIISLSLGGNGNPDDAISTAIDNAVNAGVVAVIAAGNSGPGESTIGSPGTARKAITVGATEKNNPDVLAYFSSRGPVKWIDSQGDTKYLIKPDVVAPGVNICAAYAHGISIWDSRKCLDDKHVAISGTSMATPHVAGAAALLLQKHPDWTPDEIKMALRSSADEISGGAFNPNLVGYGRINALSAVSFNGTPSIAKIETGEEISGKVNIIGTASGKQFKNYTLYYGEGREPATWTELTSSTTPVENGILYSNFDAGSLNSGDFTLRLEVTNSLGTRTFDSSLIKVRNSYLTESGNLNYFNKGNKKIMGKIFYSDYSAYKVEYREDYYSDNNPGGWKEICSKQGKLAGYVLCSFDTSSFADGAYQLRIGTNVAGLWRYSESMRIIIVKEMMDGWPLEIPGFPKGLYNLGYDGTNAKLIVPHYIDCVQSISSSLPLGSSISGNSFGNSRISQINLTNSSFSSLSIDREGNSYLLNKEAGITTACGGSSLQLYNSDSTGKILTELYAGGSKYPVPWDETPAVYRENGKDYILTHEEWSHSNYGWYAQGVFDYNGNSLYNWGGVPDTRGGYLSVTKINGESRIFNSYVDLFGNQSMYIHKFNKKGNNSANFPMQINREAGEYSLITSPIVVDSGTSKNIAIFAGNYNTSSSEVTSLILFLDIYSADGIFISRTKLLNLPSAAGISSGTILYPIAGDMNNDGKSEIIVGFQIIYKSIELDSYDPNAIESYLYIMGSDGSIIKKLDTVKGYLIDKIALADFGENKLRAIAYFDSTNSNLFNIGQGSKLMSFDADGNIGFNVGLNNDSEDYRDWIQGLVIGDVDSDSKQEIILNYRTRWYNGGSSGFKIFDSKGVMKKEIKIPTLGMADDYWGASPILADFNGDGKVDIIQQSLYLDKEWNMNTRIYAISLEGKYNQSELDWPMFMHDAQHTGVYSPYSPSLPEPCEGTDTSCGVPGNCADCTTLAPHSFCEGSASKAYDFTCSNNRCILSTTPISSTNCGTTPKVQKGCEGTAKVWSQTHKGKGCANDKCYDNGWDSKIYADCSPTTTCSGGLCVPSCTGAGKFCISNDQCCKGLSCGFFYCAKVIPAKNCAATGSACLFNVGCCSGRCNWFTCRA